MSFKIQREEEQQQAQSGFHPSSGPSENESWERDTLYKLLMSVHKEQRSSRLWHNIWRGVGAMLFAGTLFTMYSCSSGGGTGTGGNSLGSALHKQSKEHTAVIRLNGVIGGGYQDQVAMLRDGLEAAYANGKVKGIIIRANSPGGSPVISNIAFAEIRRMKAEHPNIPVYAVVEDMCASGCYYIAAAADKIYADPSSLVGSIGVIGSSFDLTGLMDKLGVKRRVRIAGSNKGMGDPFVPETPEQQALWQQMLDQIHAEFIKSVREGRRGSLNEKGYPDLFSGRVFTGLEGKKAGLVDDFGNIYSVARDVVKAPELADYTPEDNNLASLLQRRFGAEAQSKLSDWLGRVWQ